MSFLSSPRFLRTVLWIDAASCAATGLLQTVAAAPLAAWFHLPSGLLFDTGVFLIAYAAVVAFVATRDPLLRPAVWVFMAGNLAWAAACVLLLTGDRVAPTALGTAWVVLQAVVVVVLAELQFFALRRQPEAAARGAW